MTAKETAGREGKGAGGRARTREVKLGVFFTQDDINQDGYPVRDRDSCSYIATLEPASVFGDLAKAEGIRRGADHVRQLTILGDGAAWIWASQPASSPRPPRSWTCSTPASWNSCSATARTNGSPPAWKTSTTATSTASWPPPANILLAGIRKAEIDTALGCFENNAHRMRYHWFRQCSLFVGSGVVESTCKTVIGQRLKQSGMHWTTAGADAIATLRCQQASRPKTGSGPHVTTRQSRPDQPHQLNNLAHLQIDAHPLLPTPLPNVSGCRYGAGMPNQPGPGGSPPPPDRPPPSRRPPGGQPTPHDSVFRQVFGVPENAASQLRAVLPPGLAGRLDLGRLTRVPGSFVDEALKWRHSDLLFTAPLDGRDAFVYVLVEHQSSADPLMAYRMLRYVSRIWDQHLRDHPNARQLPAVIPLVVHHGRSRWTRPVQLLELIDLGPAAKQAMQDCLPRFEFLLDDLARADGRQLRDRDLTPAALITLLLLKTAAGNPRIPAELRPWAAQLRAVLDQPGGTEVFTAILTYIELVSEAPASELRDLAASLGPDAEEAYVTTAEMLRTEGRAEGRAEALVEMLTIKFGPLPESLPKTVHAASIDQIKAWAARAVTAETLGQVFG